MDPDRLEETLARQQALIERQAEAIARLEARLAAVEQDGPATAPPAAALPTPERAGLSDGALRPRSTDSTAAEDPSERAPAAAIVERPTDRRHVLGRAATAAAGAVVGGAALALGQSSPAAASGAGSFTGDPAVLATANPPSGTALRAVVQTGFAIAGDALSSGTGVLGWSVSGTGVTGTTTTGFALRARLNDGTNPEARGQNHNAGTHLLFAGAIAVPTESSFQRYRGSVLFDVNGDLWFCVASGTPGTLRKLSGPGTAGAFHALPTPKRVYDSRPGQPPAGVGPKTPLPASTARTVDLKANASGVPAGATAVLVNLIATGTTSATGGFMSIYRNGIPFPGTSNLNWSGPGQTIAVTTLTAVDEQARCAVRAGSVTDVVVDVLGYYR